MQQVARSAIARQIHATARQMRKHFALCRWINFSVWSKCKSEAANHYARWALRRAILLWKDGVKAKADLRDKSSSLRASLGSMLVKRGIEALLANVWRRHRTCRVKALVAIHHWRSFVDSQGVMRQLALTASRFYAGMAKRRGIRHWKRITSECPKAATKFQNALAMEAFKKSALERWRCSAAERVRFKRLSEACDDRARLVLLAAALVAWRKVSLCLLQLRQALFKSREEALKHWAFIGWLDVIEMRRWKRHEARLRAFPLENLARRRALETWYDAAHRKRSEKSVRERLKSLNLQFALKHWKEQSDWDRFCAEASVYLAQKREEAALRQGLRRLCEARFTDERSQSLPWPQDDSESSSSPHIDYLAIEQRWCYKFSFWQRPTSSEQGSACCLSAGRCSWRTSLSLFRSGER
eukprot:TRINITY_DN12789_c0_g2_i2.p1 TRINITY_DN12789_c0_g2~~TRINITY_DN12789_c0_g2_i2.p1  ORF type:complete len:413 (-),score=61.98 TRINITY_DN12789_c0_g2_i2:628-1866(-)